MARVKHIPSWVIVRCSESGNSESKLMCSTNLHFSPEAATSVTVPMTTVHGHQVEGMRTQSSPALFRLNDWCKVAQTDAQGAAFLLMGKNGRDVSLFRSSVPCAASILVCLCFMMKRKLIIGTYFSSRIKNLIIQKCLFVCATLSDWLTGASQVL